MDAWKAAQTGLNRLRAERDACDTMSAAAPAMLAALEAFLAALNRTDVEMRVQWVALAAAAVKARDAIAEAKGKSQ